MGLSIVCILCSCDDPAVNPQCDDILEFGPYTLAASSIQLFPYTNEIHRLIYVDEMNTEYAFELDKTGKGTNTIFYIHACPSDSTQDVTFHQLHKTQYALFRNDSLEITLYLQYNAHAYLDETTLIGEEDVLHLYVIDKDHTQTPVLGFLLKPKSGMSYWEMMEPQDSMLINDRVFQNVYSQPIGALQSQEWIGYFNFESGIVGLEHSSGSPLLSLARIE